MALYVRAWDSTAGAQKRLATLITDVADTVALLAATQTLTNKTLTTPIIASIKASASNAHAVPDVTGDTFALIAASQTLTNKTLTSPTINTATISGGTINNAVIGGTTAVAGTFTTLVANTSLALATGATVTGIDNGTVGTGSATLLATQGAIKTYVDTQVANTQAGLEFKDSVQAATTAALAYTYNNGSGTLTNPSVGAVTIDGISLSATSQRVLVKNQTAPAENGIYRVSTVGDAGTALVLTRATDFDAVGEMERGSLTYVDAGTTNANRRYIVTSADVATIGTDAVTWSLWGAKIDIMAGDGLVESNGVLAVNTGGAGGLEVSADVVGIAALGVTNAMLAGSIADTKLNTISTANKVSLAALDIDGGTDIADALADADLFIVDDGAGGTNRKSALSRIPTYLNNHANLTSLNSLTSATALVSVGTVTTGTWSATTIAVNKGGTGLTSYTNGQFLIGNTTGNTLAAAILSGDVANVTAAGVVTLAATITSVTSLANLVTVGTIAAGTWSSTISGASLAGTTTIGNTALIHRTLTEGSLPDYASAWVQAPDTNPDTAAATDIVRISGTGANDFDINKAAAAAADATAELAVLVAGTNTFADYGQIVKVKLVNPAAAVDRGVPLFLSTTAGKVSVSQPATTNYRRIVGYVAQGIANPAADTTIFMRFWPQAEGELI